MVGTRRRQKILRLRIRETALLMWETGGRQRGRALERWLAAKQELLAGSDVQEGMLGRATDGDVRPASTDDRPGNE